MVSRILATIQESLLAGRDPEARVLLIFSKLIAQPDVKKVLQALVQDGLGRKERQAAAGIMERLVEAVADVKCSNTTEGREMRQLLHNI